MSEQLYRRYDVDEDTPVQFVGVYTTHWRPEWGEPEVMFAQVDDPLTDAAEQMLEALEAIKAACNADEFIKIQGDLIGHIVFGEAAAKVDAAIAAAKGEQR